MAKRKPQVDPWPETIWYARGKNQIGGLLSAVRAHLHSQELRGKTVRFRKFDRHDSDGDFAEFVFDATWQTEDGATIKARLCLEPDMLAVLQRLLTQDDFVDDDQEFDYTWTVTAEADQPWRDEWPSPVTTFFPPPHVLSKPWGYDVVAGQMSYHNCTGLADRALLQVPEFLRMLAQQPGLIVVITHDRRSDKEICDRPTLAAVVDHLPDGLLGRVVEIRVSGDQDQFINEVLSEHRVGLPWGGAVLVPPSPRLGKWSSADYSVRGVPGGGIEELMSKAALLVLRHAGVRPHMTQEVRKAVEDLRKEWALSELEMAPQRALALKAEAEETAAQAHAELQRLRSSLVQEAELREKAEQAAEQARQDVEALRREYQEQPLAVQAREAQEQAETLFDLLDTAEALLDDQTGEIMWLRQQLAKMPGRAYGELPPAPDKGPLDWTEMFDLVGELMPHIAVGDIWGPLAKLRPHKHEDVWLRKSWQVLQTLEAYAQAKEEQGADVLPHLTAYLNWPQATDLIPATLYVAGEANLRGTQYEEARVFHADGLGPVFMGEHFRIGGVRPPAPRMHVFDDTGGPTGLVHLGYLGAHLPNGSTT